MRFGNFVRSVVPVEKGLWACGTVVVLLCVLCVSATGQQRPNRQRPSADDVFSRRDRNGDGFLTRDELPPSMADRLLRRLDANHDGKISREEDRAFRQRRARARRPRRWARVPEGTRVEKDLVYARVGRRELHLDLYLPEKAKRPLPVVCWVHGGGWKSGSKEGGGPAVALVARGYAVASIEYRLSGEAKFPAAVADCKAAIRWLRANADKYGLDPKRFGAWGSSAGGHLVALLGTAGDDVKLFDLHKEHLDQSAEVQAVCDWFGPTDFLRMNDFPSRIDHLAPDSPESQFIGGPVLENRDKCRQASPLTYVTPDDPPFLIMHGDKDNVVPYNQSELLYEALKKAGVEVTLYCVKGGGHGFGGAVQDTRESLIQMVAEFFDKHLKGEPGR